MTRTVSRRVFLQVAGLAAATGLAGCGTSSGDGNPESTTTTTTTTTTTGGATTTTVEPSGPTVAMRTDNKGSYFHPKGLLVDPGTTVTFVNESGAHATTAYHPDNGKTLRIPEAASSWNSPLYSETGVSFDVTFDTPGVYDYYCPPHEVLGMVGRIVVGEPQGGPGTTPVDDLPPAARSKMPSIEDILAAGEVAGP